MQPHVQVLLSGALTFGVPLAFAIRELIVLRRRGAAPPHDDDRPRLRPKPVPGDDASLPPLPDSLIRALRVPPVNADRRRRVLEDA